MDLSFLHEKQGNVTEFEEAVKSIHCETEVDENIIIDFMLDRLIDGFTIKDAAGLLKMNIYGYMAANDDSSTIN